MSGDEIKLAMIGLDTSHSVEFPKRMQSDECPDGEKVEGMRVVSCMRFETPFQNKDGLDKRQASLESWGVKVTESFEEAVAGCDAVMLEINDPSLHLEYFRKAVKLGKRIFVDKPFADTASNALEMKSLAKDAGVEVMSCSPLRYAGNFDEALTKIGKVDRASFFGPLGKAPAGSSIVWYGVHACEMLVKAMGLGALKVSAVPDPKGTILLVDYEDGRRGVVELLEGAYAYGGCMRRANEASVFVGTLSYAALLRKVGGFFETGLTDATLEAACEVTSIIHAGELAFHSGRPQAVSR